MEDRMINFLRYWYNSDAGNFLSFLMTVFTLSIPFMRVSLQCCTVIIILQIVLFGDSHRQKSLTADKNSAIRRPFVFPVGTS